MSDAVDANATTPAKKSKTAKPKKAKPASTHPKVSEMVNAAIGNLKERGGSSLKAIKKYVSSHYKVDAEKLSPFIKKYLRSAVTSGSLIQTKGKGASGSFKLSAGGDEKKSAPKKAKAAPAKKAAAVKKAKPASAKKPAAKPKKAVTPKKKPAAKKAATVKKTPVKKAAPKVKKPKSPKKSPAKKAAAKKTKK